jgi:hypothetical protein
VSLAVGCLELPAQCVGLLCDDVISCRDIKEKYPHLEIGGGEQVSTTRVCACACAQFTACAQGCVDVNVVRGQLVARTFSG